MALIKKTGTETAATEAHAETPAETKATPAAAQTPETKEVAVKPSAAAPAPSKVGSFWYTNDAVQEILDDVRYGDFPSIIASQGSFKIAADKTNVGEIIEFRAVQAKKKKICSPNSQDDEARDFFAAAYEGELTMDGRTIEQCVLDAKAAGYDRADIKDYVDLFGLVTANSSDKVDLAGEFVMLQLAPMSVLEWNKFSKRLQMDAAFGKLQITGAPIVRATATAAFNAQKKEYTKFTFELAPDQN